MAASRVPRRTRPKGSIDLLPSGALRVRVYAGQDHSPRSDDTLAGKHSLLLVDTNEQAARVCAAVRAELVRLGQVQEHGVELGLQGTVAGVGDLVEARAIAWDLAGYAGNPRGVINRERFRVRCVRPEGALEVAPLEVSRLGDCDPGGATLVLSPDYVAQHLALGYASTVHATQGGTVDTTHTVVTGRTGPAALYVGMSRGRDATSARLDPNGDVAHRRRGAHAATAGRQCWHGRNPAFMA